MPVNFNPWWEHIIDNYNDPENNTDLCIAVNLGSNQADGRIRLNFKHMCARVFANLHTDLGPEYEVRVKEIALKDFATHGRLVFPKYATTSEVTNERLFSLWTTYTRTGPERTFFKAVDDSYLVLGPEGFESVPDGLYFIPIDLLPENWSGSYAGTRFEVAYKIVEKATGKTVWPDSSVEYQNIYPEDKSYYLSHVFLETATPSSRWLPGTVYTYDLNVAFPATQIGKQMLKCEAECR